MNLYIASDHAGFELKQELITFLQDTLNLSVDDCGPYEFNPDDDYPDWIAIAAKKLSRDVQVADESCAIVIGASGQGEAMVANRFEGVRCALYYGASKMQKDSAGNELDIIASARAHNDANALSLGARFISVDEAKIAVQRFLETPFSGAESHTRRVQKIETVTS